MSDAVEPERFEIALSEQALGDLHERLRRTRWPDQPAGIGWDAGMDIGYLRELCTHWLESYDPARLEDRLGAFRAGAGTGCTSSGRAAMAAGFRSCSCTAGPAGRSSSST